MDGPYSAALELAEKVRKILLLDVEIAAVDAGHGGLGVLREERGRQNPVDLLLQPRRPVAIVVTRNRPGVERLVRIRDLVEQLCKRLPLLRRDAASEFAPGLRVEGVEEVCDVARAFGCRENHAVVREADAVDEFGRRWALSAGIGVQTLAPLRGDLLKALAGLDRLADIGQAGDLAFHGALDALFERAGRAGFEGDDPGVFHETPFVRDFASLSALSIATRALMASARSCRSVRGGTSVGSFVTARTWFSAEITL